MAASNEAGALFRMNSSTDDPEGDADTEGSGTDNEKSTASEQPKSLEKQPLSMRRRVALVAALLLCVFTVFAFALLLPCHKPKCQKPTPCPGHGDLVSVDWSSSFGGITPLMISQIDVSPTGNPDILLEFRIEEKEVKNSSFLSQLCKNSNCHGGGLLAIHGSCGNGLWDFSTNSTFGLMVCEKVDNKRAHTEYCLLVEEKHKLLLLDTHNGTRKWQLPAVGKIYSFGFINDADGDDERDVVLVHEPNKLSLNSGNIKLNVISGLTGQILGSSLALPDGHNSSDILAIHKLSSGQQFVIVGSVSPADTSSSLWAISVHDLLVKINDSSTVIPGQPWGKHLPNHHTGFISVLKNVPILVQPLLTDLNADGVRDIVLCIKESGISLVALNGNNLTVMWKTVIPHAAIIHKLFAAEHAPKDNFSDVAMFIEYCNQSSALLLVSGPTGKISWSFDSSSGLPVAPVSVPATFSLQQAFVVWLPKLDTLSLITKSSQLPKENVPQQEHDEVVNNNNVDKQKEKYVSLLPEPEKKRRVRDIHSGVGRSVISPFKLLHRQDGDLGGVLDDNNDDDETDDDDDEGAMRGLNLDVMAEAWHDEADDAQLAMLRDILTELERVTVDADYDDDDDNDNNDDDDEEEEEFPRNEKFLDFSKQQNIDKSDLYPFGRNHKLSKIVDEEEGSDAGAGGADQNTLELEHELKDLTLRKTDKHVSSADHKAKHAFVAKDVPLKVDLSSSLQEITQHQTRLSDSGEESNSQNMPATASDHKEILPENGVAENLMLAQGNQPNMYHKRSVPSKQTGSKCVTSSGDDAASLVALLMMRDDRGGQKFVQIMEERPLYLGADEYGDLFNDGVDVQPCLRLVPRITSEPVLRYAEEHLDLVYTVSYVSEDGTLHVGKIRKLSLTDAFEKLKGKNPQRKLYSSKHHSKREFDYSFSFPRII